MEQQIRAFALVGIVLPPKTRREMKRLRQELRHLTETVDSFYGLLGPRNWVFSDDLHISEISKVIETHDPLEAERRLIAYYKQEDRLRFAIMRLRRFDAMRPRMDLVLKALDDYQEGRYYSTVLVLLAIMDGFVNDFEKQQRRGLHTRSGEEMVAWDSVAGHHLGLSHAHRTFVKQVKKTDENTATELLRNGIMHGMVTNFDNEIIATKAWNRLFAVADWADASVKQAAPIEPTPSLRESLKRYGEVMEQRKRLDAWTPYEYDVSQDDVEQSEVVATCTVLLEHWEKKQWGPLGRHFIEFGSLGTPFGQQAQNARSLYEAYVLSSWSILRVRHIAAAVAITEVSLVVNGGTQTVELRWVRTDPSNGSAAEWEEGRWTLSPYGPSTFISDTTGQSSVGEPPD